MQYYLDNELRYWYLAIQHKYFIIIKVMVMAIMMAFIVFLNHLSALYIPCLLI